MVYLNNARRKILLNTPHIESASGNVCTFSTDLKAPLKECKASFLPVQNLNGYDSPWFPGGGTNLIDFDQICNSIVNTPSVLLNTGIYYLYVANDMSVGFNSFAQYSSDNVTFTIIETSSENADVYVDKKMQYNQKKCMVTVVNPIYLRVNLQINAATTGAHIKLLLTKNSQNYNEIPATLYLSDEYFQEIYAPYSNICPITGRSRLILTRSGANASDTRSIAVVWETVAGIVYGGILDVTTGVLTVDRASYTWSSNGQLSSTGAFLLPKNDAITINGSNQTTLLGAVCDKLPSGTWEQISNRSATVSRAGCAWGNSLAFRIVGYTTAEEYLNFLANNPLQFVYLLDNPQTYQLTPIEVKTLLGVNNIWSNANENIEVKFWKH